MEITRRSFVAGLTASAAAALLPRIGRSAPPSQPNVIMFLADDLRWDCFGFMGHPIVKTPNIDALSVDSLVFSNSFVTTSVCPCGRASILTGQTTSRHHIFDYNIPLSARALERTYPALMRAKGYYTGFIGKWGIGDQQPSEHFDYWDGFKRQGAYFDDSSDVHITTRQNQSAQRFLRSAREPFLLLLHFKAPHVPALPQPEFAHLYDAVQIPRPETDTHAQYLSLPRAIRHSMIGRHKTYRTKSFAKLQQYLKGYYGLVSGIDAVIGDTIATLRNLNVDSRTTLFITSDNGLMQGEHGLMGKGCMYEESLRVPLIIRQAKDFTVGSRAETVPQFALNIDLAPTILQMCGIDVPRQMEGASLLQAIARPDRWRKDFLYTLPTILYIPAFSGVRGERWKYASYPIGDDRTAADEVLFDLEQDPLETVNLADDKRYRDTLEALRERTALLLADERNSDLPHR